MKPKTLNPITLQSKVIISDPCYVRGTWCMGSLDNLLTGEYIPKLKYSKDGRVRELSIMHSSIGPKSKLKWIKTDIHVGVDSGQAGIFCDTIYPQVNPDVPNYDNNGGSRDLNSFYGQCCNATMGDDYNNLERWYRKEQSVKDFDQSLKKYQDSISEGKIIERKTFFPSMFFQLGFFQLLDKLITQQEFDKSNSDHRETLIQELGDKPEWYQGGTVYGKGVVSQSGWGDGSYSCYVAKNTEQQIIGIKIKFL